MSAADQITDLSRELAIHRVQEAIDKLGGRRSNQLAAQTAEVLEEAAGALACTTAVYVTPGGRLDGHFHEQIGDLIAAAASLEQLANFSRHTATGNTTTSEELIMPNPNLCRPIHATATPPAPGIASSCDKRADDAWQVLDIAVIETLTGDGEGRDAAEALARDYAQHDTTTTSRRLAPAVARAGAEPRRDHALATRTRRPNGRASRASGP